MKTKTLKLWMSLGLVSLGLLGCDETDFPLEPQCIEARVITHICGHAVIQVISPAFDHLGEDGWTNHDGQTYDNVFSTQLNCREIELIPEEGETFHFKVTTKKEEVQNCIVCQALPAQMPDTKIEMEITDECMGINQ